MMMFDDSHLLLVKCRYLISTEVIVFLGILVHIIDVMHLFGNIIVPVIVVNFLMGHNLKLIYQNHVEDDQVHI
jgi:hypothetical protein